MNLHTPFRWSWVCDWVTSCEQLGLLCLCIMRKRMGMDSCSVLSHHLCLMDLALDVWSFQAWKPLGVPWHSFRVQALGPVPHMRAGARSPGARPQHFVFGCSAVLFTEQVKYPSLWSGAIGWLVQLSPTFWILWLCPFLTPLPHLLSEPHVSLSFHFAFRKEKEVPTLPQHSCRVLDHRCIWSDKDGMRSYHGLPCAYTEVVRSYLGWCLNNLLSVRIHNFFSHVTLCVFVSDVFSRRKV